MRKPYAPLPNDRQLNDEEMGEFMVVTKGRRTTPDEIEAWLKEGPPEAPVMPQFTVIPITSDMSPVLKEIIRNQIKQNLYNIQRADFERRREVGFRTILGQINSMIPTKEWVWAWMDEKFAAAMADWQTRHDEVVVALGALKVRTFDLIERGIVLIGLGRFGRWLNRRP